MNRSGKEPSSPDPANPEELAVLQKENERLRVALQQEQSRIRSLLHDTNIISMSA